MAKDPAFLFYSSDFYMGTVGMTDAQVGQYIRLMCLQHQKGRLSEAAMKSVIGNRLDPVILSKFLVDEKGRYFNARLEEETERRRRYSESRRRNRAGTGSADPEEINTCDTHEEDVSDKSADTRKEAGKEPESDRFDRFWAAYPRKVAKVTARRAFNKIKPDDALLKTMLEAIEYYQHTDQWTRDSGKFIPHPATWLRQKRWEDEMGETAPGEVIQWTIS